LHGPSAPRTGSFNSECSSSSRSNARTRSTSQICQRSQLTGFLIEATSKLRQSFVDRVRAKPSQESVKSWGGR
jgi:hypothetical protein